LDDHARADLDPGERAEIDRALGHWSGAAPVTGVERLPGLTNRTYLVVTEEGSLVVRLPGGGTDAFIDRDAEHHNATVAADLGVGAPVLHSRRGVVVSPFIEGRVLSPDIVRSEPETLARVGRLLRRVHDCPRPFVSRFDPVAVIADHRSRLLEVPTGVDDLIARAGQLDRATTLTPSHNDPWPRNVIDSGDRLHLIDWEYSGLNEPAWDLADLAVEAGLDSTHRDALVRAYSGGRPDTALSDRIAELAPVTDLLWGLWALGRERDSNRPEDFGAYGRRRLERAARALR
jgi:thiamine kinase-like enzyme